MSRIPGGRPSGPRVPECCKQKKPCCPPGMRQAGPDGGRIPGGPPGGSRIPGAPPGVCRIPGAPPGGSRIPGGPPGVRRIPSGPPSDGSTRTIYAGISRPPYAAVSKTIMSGISKPHPVSGKATGMAISRTSFTGKAASNERKGIAVAVTKKLPEPPAPKKPSRLQRFDHHVTAELSRRRDPTPTTTTTSDTALLEAVDRLARAEAAHSFAGAVAAAEAAAATASDPTAAEEAAAEGARCFQAELVDVVADDVPGVKPIQVIGYVGITKPKYAAR